MPKAPDAGSRWRHVKNRKTYQVVSGTVFLQASTAREVEEQFDNTWFTVYFNLQTREHYVRPTAEFLDGRFELVS